jgi:hypothetical protein
MKLKLLETGWFAVVAKYVNLKSGPKKLSQIKFCFPYILSPGALIFKILVSIPHYLWVLWGVDTNILKIRAHGLEI